MNPDPNPSTKRINSSESLSDHSDAHVIGHRNPISNYEVIIEIGHYLHPDMKLILPSDDRCLHKFMCTEFHSIRGYRIVHGFTLKVSLSKLNLKKELLETNSTNDSMKPFFHNIIIRTALSFNTIVSKHYGFYSEVNKQDQCIKCTLADQDYYSSDMDIGTSCYLSSFNAHSTKFNWLLKDPNPFKPEFFFKSMKRNGSNQPNILAKKNNILLTLTPAEAVQQGFIPIINYNNYKRDRIELLADLKVSEYIQLPSNGLLNTPWEVSLQFDLNVKRTHWWIFSQHPNAGKTHWATTLCDKYGAIIAPRCCKLNESLWWESITENTKIIVFDEYTTLYLQESVMNGICDGTHQFNRKGRLPLVLKVKPLIIVLSNFTMSHFYPSNSDDISLIGARFNLFEISRKFDWGKDQPEMRAIATTLEIDGSTLSSNKKYLNKTQVIYTIPPQTPQLRSQIKELKRNGEVLWLQTQLTIKRKRIHSQDNDYIATPCRNDVKEYGQKCTKLHVSDSDYQIMTQASNEERNNNNADEEEKKEIQKSPIANVNMAEKDYIEKRFESVLEQVEQFRPFICVHCRDWILDQDLSFAATSCINCFVDAHLKTVKE
jgi:hypothetical protein